jgi:hypothetical protein
MTRQAILALVILGACAPGPSRAPQPPAPAASAAPAPDSLQRSREQYVAQIRQSIAGRETQPANQVFKNVTMFADVPANRLLAVMNIGFSRSLGVSCDHCHVPGEWDREDKPQKNVTRQMSAMARVINDSLLKKVTGLRNANPVVNCTTCHRGQVKPATDLPR